MNYPKQLRYVETANSVFEICRGDSCPSVLGPPFFCATLEVVTTEDGAAWAHAILCQHETEAEQETYFSMRNDICAWEPA